MEWNTVHWRTVLRRAGVAAFGLFLLTGYILYFGYAGRRMIDPPSSASW